MAIPTRLLKDSNGNEVIGKVEASPTANTVLDRLKTLGTKLDTLHGTGTPYLKADTATVDTARRFETASKFLNDAHIVVTGNAQLFGNSSAQTFTVAVNGTLYFKRIDISKLYFKNATAGANGTVTVLATEEV